MEKRALHIIGAPFGWGAKRHEAALGPSVLEKKSLPASWKMLTPSIPYDPSVTLNFEERLRDVIRFDTHLAQVVKQFKQEAQFPIVVGGDHSIAIGTWSGMVSGLEAQGQFGLIWLDAHMDSHTIETTPSQAIHGMPLAALLGYGDENLTNILEKVPKLDPRHVVIIGVRSFEKEESALLERLKVKVFHMDEVKEKGFARVFAQALDIVTLGTKGFGISIDMDAFDPRFAPGTGTPVPDGLNPSDVIPCLKELISNPYFQGLEIVEIDPTRDVDDKTIDLVQEIILSMQ